MKKIILFVAITIASINLFAQTVVNIPDINLRNAIKAKLGINTADPIYDTDMLNLTTLTVTGIDNLTGLHYAINLDTLDLYNSGNLQYLSELSNLTNLTYLNLGNQYGATYSSTSLSHLQNLVNLKYLNIEFFGDNINFSFLSNLINLKVLKAKYVRYPTNLNGLSNMLLLDSLDFSDCKISDISALSTLTNLKYLNLFNNNINEGQLHHLYTMDLLMPVLDLRNNGTGFSNDSISKLYNELASIDSVPGNILYQVAQRTIQLTSNLRINCAFIDTITIDTYRLTGDIFVQNLVSGVATYSDFISIQGTSVVVDKFISSLKPRISGNGKLYAFGQKITEGPFLFRAVGSSLVPQESYPTDYMIDGFLPSGGALMLHSAGQNNLFVRSEFALFNLKYPFDKIHKYLFQLMVQDTSATYFFPQIGGYYEYRKINNIVSSDIYLNIMIHGPLNFGAFMLEDVEIKFQGDTLAGGFRLKVPGKPSVHDLTKTVEDAFADTPEIISYNEENIINPNNQKSPKAIFPFLDIDIRAQFAHGVINGFSCALGTNIPLGASGLKLTSVRAGVQDLQSPEWRVLGLVNIESAISVPVLGPVVSIEDLGVKFGPVFYLEGQGTFKVFGWEVANGNLLYMRDKEVLRMRGTLDLGGVLKGTLRTSLEQFELDGILNGSMHTPATLPWKLKSLANKDIGSVYTHVTNNIISTEIEAFGLSLATRLEYGKPTLPYFHFYLGTNLSNLTQIFKSTNIQNFEIHPNTSKVLIIAGNDTSLFDFTVTSPAGLTYNAQNAQFYEKNTDSKQTIMVINTPQSGFWNFNTTQTGPITLSVDAINEAPVGYFTSPTTFQSADKLIKLICNDYLDTLTVTLYYDDDNKDFDGTKIATYTGINQFEINHLWNTLLVHTGEYYIYCRIDDGKNAIKSFYANGTILINNPQFNLTPQNLTAENYTDSVQVSWTMNADTNIFCTRVLCRNMATSEITDYIVTDTNTVMLHNLGTDKTYEVWAQYFEMTMEGGPMSNKVTIAIYDSTTNSIPQFVEDNAPWNFIIGQQATYPLNIIHLDNGTVVFSILNDTLGFSINQNLVSWTPMNWHSGFYTLTFVVTDDSLAADTMLQQVFVVPQQQTQASLTFNSPQLYNGGSGFVMINDMNVDTNIVDIQLKNLRTSQQINLNCYYSGGTLFIGYFDVNASFNALADGDTIKATYTAGGITYTAIAIYCHFQMGLHTTENIDNNPLLYPNPNNGQFEVTYDMDKDDKMYWDVFALNGKLIRSGNYSEKTHQFKLNDISHGTYILLLRNNNKYHILKFIKN